MCCTYYLLASYCCWLFKFFARKIRLLTFSGFKELRCLLTCPRTTRIASCCSKILSTILAFEPHLAHTSPFSFFWGKPFCTCVSLRSLCLFQLLENAATTFRHTDNVCSILLSFKPLFMAKSKLRPNQLSRLHFNNWHASLMLLALPVVMAVSLFSLRSRCPNVTLKASCSCTPVWSSGKWCACKQCVYKFHCVSM